MPTKSIRDKNTSSLVKMDNLQNWRMSKIRKVTYSFTLKCINNGIGMCASPFLLQEDSSRATYCTRNSIAKVSIHLL